MENVPKARIRLKFARLAKARNLSHLEQIKALRDLAAASGLRCCPAPGRAQAPKMAFGPAISLGYESRCEYADLYLAEFVRDEDAARRIRAVGSECYELVSAKRVPVFFPSIEAAVNAAEYALEAGFPAGFSQKDIDAFLARPEALYEKVKPSGERETIDVRPLICAAEYDPAAAALRLVLKSGPGKNVKPEAVLGMIVPGAEIKRIVRRELYWQDSKGALQVF